MVPVRSKLLSVGGKGKQDASRQGQWEGEKPSGQKVVVLWANTTLGLIGFWWRGTRQHQGRARLTITRLRELPMLGPRQLSEEQINCAQSLFDELADRRFLPANESYHDPTRIALDEAVLVDLLNLSSEVLEPLAVLRQQWCAEPTVHGGKQTRPGGGN